MINMIYQESTLVKLKRGVPIKNIFVLYSAKNFYRFSPAQVVEKRLNVEISKDELTCSKSCTIISLQFCHYQVSI